MTDEKEIEKKLFNLITDYEYTICTNCSMHSGTPVIEEKFNEARDILIKAIDNFINTHYIPKDAPTGYNLVGECENCNGRGYFDTIYQNERGGIKDDCPKCVDGKISRPMTLQEMIDSYGMMYEFIIRIKESAGDSIMGKMPINGINPDRINFALTLNGCRIEKA